MINRRNFDIAFVGLKPGLHDFEYEINDEFFAEFGEQDFSNCIANVKLTLEKNAVSLMRLKFEIGGNLEVLCDRCGNELKLDLWDEFNMVVKLVEEPEIMNEQEDDPDIFYISKGASHLHLADWIFEFINLSIPMQRVCGTDEANNSKCNLKSLELLNKLTSDKEEEKKPIWKGLEKFKGLDQVD